MHGQPLAMEESVSSLEEVGFLVHGIVYHLLVLVGNRRLRRGLSCFAASGAGLFSS